MKYAPYSFSKLSTHKQCNRKFKYVYIDKAPQDYKDMTALLKGGAVHSIIEHYPQPSQHKLASEYQYIFDSFLHSTLGQTYLNRDCIKEYNFGLTKQLMPTTYSDKEAMFRGSVDYIAIKDDCLFLCDWKTGKLKEEKYQSYDQLMFYAIYFFRKYEHINTIVISYVYVEHNFENTMMLKREYLFNYVSELVGLIKNAENDISFVKNVGPLCNWCEFKTHCDGD